ncbi:MAG TPA: hypothetical protein VK141_03305 [Nitrosomonas sp.]|nr:hypothetical protein [Nitrosomonas sp.]
MAPTTELPSSQCFHPRLEVVESLHLPTILSNPEMSGEDEVRPSGDNLSDSILADPAVVPSGSGDGMRFPSHAAEDEISADGPIRPSSSTVRHEILPVNRLAIIRDRFEERGIPENVSELLLDEERRSTSKAYESSWRSWHRWCQQREINPLFGSLENVLSYLTYLFENGKAYRTIGVHRSCLSSILPKIDGEDVGNHPLVRKLLKAIYNRIPPHPKYKSFWDVNAVLLQVKS